MISNLITAWPVFQYLLIGAGSLAIGGIALTLLWMGVDKLMEGKNNEQM